MIFNEKEIITEDYIFREESNETEKENTPDTEEHFTQDEAHREEKEGNSEEQTQEEQLLMSKPMKTSLSILCSQFFSYKLDPNEGIATGISNIEALASQFNSMQDGIIEEPIIMAKILSALPSQYRHVTRAWDSVRKEEQNLDALRGRLLKEKLLLKTYENERLRKENEAFTVSSRTKRTTGNG